MEGTRSRPSRRASCAGWGRARRTGVTLGGLGILAAAAGVVSAQSTPSVQARVDNDGFNFWRKPWERTDGEYTSGVRVAVETGQAPFWRLLAPHAAPCADVRDDALRCSSALVTVGQDMYTPAEDSQPYSYTGWRRQRPYAGWLYSSLTVRTVRRSTMRSLGITLGVTGPPSPADRTQRRAHEIMGRYTIVPVGWETQVRFEPGIIVTARQRWMLATASIKGVRLLDASVDVGAAAGNVLTNAEAGGRVRGGMNLSHPWRRERRRGFAEVGGELGVRGQLIARNIFLDGNTMHATRWVVKVPAVADVYGSLGVRMGPVVLAYAVTQRSREYTTGTRDHTFSSLIVGLGGIPSGSP